MSALIQLSSIDLFSQNFFVNENFSSASGSTPPTGWSQNQLYTTSPTTDFWRFDNPGSKSPGGNFSGAFGIFDSENYSNNGASENIALTTPIFSTQGFDTVWIKFDIAFGSGGTANGNLEVFDGVNWIEVIDYPNTGVTARTDSVNVSAFIKNNCNARVRFRWSSNSGGWWAIDNVKIFSNGSAKNLNISPAALLSPLSGICANHYATVKVKIKNDGLSTVTSMPVSVEVFDGNSTQSFSETITGSLAACRDTIVTLSSTIDIFNDSNYVLKVVTSMSGDQQVPNSDTLKITNFRVTQSPLLPSDKLTKVCGYGDITDSVEIRADEDAFWYNSSTSATPILRNSKITLKAISEDTTVYVETLKMANGFYPLTSYTQWGWTANIASGIFLNITAKTDVLIDSLEIRSRVGGTVDYAVDIRKGGYIGYTTTPTAWNTVYKGSVTTGTLVHTPVFVGGISLKANETIGVFLYTTSASNIEFASGPVSGENNDISFYSNEVSSNVTYSGTLSNFGYGGRIFYVKPCYSNRAKYQYDVGTRPFGANIIQGPVFEGVYDDPDIIAEGKTLQYDLVPPTGFNNSDFNNTWLIDELSLMTINGTQVPASDTLILALPSSAGNARIQYKPGKGWADSTIVFRMRVRDQTNTRVCDSLVQRIIFVAPTPVIQNQVSDACLGTPVLFYNNSKISSGFISYQWDFGDSTYSNVKDAIHYYKKQGTYMVKLTLTSDFGIKADSVFKVTIFEIPSVDFKVVNSCQGEDVKFINNTSFSSGGLIYSWNFGDGQSSSDKDPKHSYSQIGGYLVTLVARANGCEGSLQKNANLFATPKAAFTYDGDCTGHEIYFTNTSTINMGESIGTTWYFDNGDLGTLPVQPHIFLTPGNKPVKLIAFSQFGCKDSIIKSVFVKPSPVASFTFDKICDLDPSNFTNTTFEPADVKVDYVWDFGDGETSVQKNPTHQYTKLGYKLITLSARGDNGCSDNTEQRVLVEIQPKADFDAADGCWGEPINFVNNSSVLNGTMRFFWLFGDGDSSKLIAPKKIYKPTRGTSYSVVLKVMVDDGCFSLANKVIDVDILPTCGFSYKISQNDRKKITFTPNDLTYPAGSYSWVFEGSGFSNEMTPTHVFEYYDTDYRVIFSITSKDGCRCVDSSVYVKTAWSVGIRGISKNEEIMVYPNPTSGSVTMKIDDWNLNDEAAIIVMDATGRNVKTLQMKDNLNGVQTINLDDLVNGYYWIQVRSGDHKFTSKTFPIVLKR